VGVEPTGDTARCHPPVLKTETITGPHALPLSIYNNITLTTLSRTDIIIFLNRTSRLLCSIHEVRGTTNSAISGKDR